ncbi:response regulator [Pseudomonas abieticivorans]|uniref:response regulator n=1 Tax=Pseudomonas abieticivorans TaxID=2931382 RepID=UPI0020BF4E62|nr:response regulator [Pseudomonas sp. PIA16]
MIRIGKVAVSLARREVLDGDQVVKLGSRAFDILEVLLAANGQMVSKDELLTRVWPNAVVEENNLQVHVSTLRKVLGADRDIIRTVPGRGYRLIREAPSAAPQALERDSLLIELLERLELHDRQRVDGPAKRVAPLPTRSFAETSEPLNLPQCPLDPIVYIVDDEPSVRTALSRLLRSAGIATQTFACAEDFLREPFAERLACLVLDVNLQAGSGFDLQQTLQQMGCPLPIIFMTGYGTIPLSVKAIKAGAQEFLTKPFDEGQLLAAIDSALAHARRTWASRSLARDVRGRFDSLTAREREVLMLLIDGKVNKQVAAALGTREITAKVHKKHVMSKMKAGSLIELVRLCESIGVGPLLARPSFS